jgi:hypothetical protein
LAQFLKADSRTLARVDKLARKCNEGELTPEETTEYQTNVRAGDVNAMLRAKVRLLFRRPAAD